MEHANLSTASQPQADGADRPFDTHGVTGPVLVHTEKSGPAFDGRHDLGTLPSTEDMLVQSIQAHALKTAGEVLNALHRGCLLDVCASWPRLLKVAGVTSLGARRAPREGWAYAELREAVELALVYAEQPTSIHWQQADATLRGYVLETAAAIESRLDRADVSADSLRVAGLVDAYRAFAEGRDA